MRTKISFVLCEIVIEEGNGMGENMVGKIIRLRNFGL